MRLGWLAGLAVTGVLMGTAPAWADEGMPAGILLDGLYEGEGSGILSLTLINLESDTFAALMTTRNPGRCVGRIAGIGKLVGTEMVIENVEARDDAVCRLTIRFDGKGKNGRSMRIVSTGQCSYFHGAACGFSGTLRQVTKPSQLKP